MLLNAIFMIRGLRNAWWIALLLSAVSCIGHLMKAIDFEEAIFALSIFVMLLFSRKEYVIKGNPRLHSIGIWSAVMSMITVIIYGTIGFYFLDKKHFGMEFNILQSIVYTFRNFVLIMKLGIVSLSTVCKGFPDFNKCKRSCISFISVLYDHKALLFKEIHLRRNLIKQT